MELTRLCSRARPRPSLPHLAPAPRTMKQSSDSISARARRRIATSARKAPPSVHYRFGARGPSTICQAIYNLASRPTAASGSAHRRDTCCGLLAGRHGSISVRL